MPPRFVHDLINKLAVIIGHCDLLKEDLRAGSQCTERLDVIHSVAAQIARDLNEHQRQISDSTRRPVQKQEVA